MFLAACLLASARGPARGQALNELCGAAGSPVACPKVKKNAPPPGVPAAVSCADLDDLYGAICNERDYSSAMEIEISRVKGAIQSQAQDQAFKDAAAAAPSDFNQAFFLAYTQAAEKFAAAALGAAPAEFIKVGDDARAALLLAVESRASLPAAAKSRMTGILNGVKVLLPSQYLQLPGIDGDMARASLRETCSSGGVATNAFSDTSSRASVVFCPGYLIERAVVFKRLTPRERLSSLSLVMAHELAHQIDIGSFPWVYDRYASCLQSAAAATPEEFPDLRDRWREITADYWAAEAIVSEKQDAASIIRDVQGSFCGREEGPRHPSGKFRTNVILARQAGVRAAFGCPAVAPPRLACTMDGLAP